MGLPHQHPPSFRWHCLELSLPEGSELSGKNLVSINTKHQGVSVTGHELIYPGGDPPLKKKVLTWREGEAPCGAAHPQPAAPSSPQTPALLQGALCWLSAVSSPSGWVSCRN